MFLLSGIGSRGRKKGQVFGEFAGVHDLNGNARIIKAYMFSAAAGCFLRCVEGISELNGALRQIKGAR